MNWEVIHAVTMIPGMFIRPKSISYRAFCSISCAYHFCKSFRKKRKKAINYLQRADLTSQLIACLANSSRAHQYMIITLLLLTSTKLDIQKEKHRRIHLAMNGVSILICNGIVRPSIYLWGMVFMCCVATNLTHIQIFHSAMHLFGHAAFALQE